MICSYCGAEVTDQKSTFCPRCGRPIAGPVLVTAPAATNDLSGVSGWLLLVCVALTIGIPLFTVYNWVKFLSLGIGHIPWSSILISIVMAAWSFTAGLFLWTVRPNAVRIAKAYFIAEMCLPFVFGLRLLFDLVSSRVEMSPWTVFAVFFRPLLLGGIGYLYLRRSRRVQATYSKAVSAAA